MVFYKWGRFRVRFRVRFGGLEEKKNAEKNSSGLEVDMDKFQALAAKTSRGVVRTLLVKFQIIAEN